MLITLAAHSTPAFTVGMVVILLVIVVIVRVVGKLGEGLPPATADEEREDNIW